MKKLLLISIIFSLFIISACSNDLPESKKENNDAIKKTYISMEKKFTPPNFKVSEFRIINSKENVNFYINYQVQPSLYELLKHNDNKYYFQLIFPNKVSKIIGKEKTSIVKGTTMNDNNLNYSVKLTTKLNNKLKSTDKEYLEKEKEGYGLYIYDYDKFPIHYFDDLEVFSSL